MVRTSPRAQVSSLRDRRRSLPASSTPHGIGSDEYPVSCSLIEEHVRQGAFRFTLPWMNVQTEGRACASSQFCDDLIKDEVKLRCCVSSHIWPRLCAAVQFCNTAALCEARPHGSATLLFMESATGHNNAACCLWIRNWPLAALASEAAAGAACGSGNAAAPVPCVYCKRLWQCSSPWLLQSLHVSVACSSPGLLHMHRAAVSARQGGITARRWQCTRACLRVCWDSCLDSLVQIRPVTHTR